MKITILTLFPQMIQPFTGESIIKRAHDKQLVIIELINLREFALDSYGTVDDRPYGGGAGMILRVDVLQKALDSKSIRSGQPGKKVVLTSPRGIRFTQEKAREYAALEELVIIAGHYEGVDERIMSSVDEELSLGDFVMTGGEITAAAVVDSVVRILPGVLKKEEAAKEESFFSVSIHSLIEVVGKTDELNTLLAKGMTEVTLLEYPHYTRPEEFNGQRIPDVLLSGNHKEIEKWRLRRAFEVTKTKRPDLLFNK